MQWNQYAITTIHSLDKSAKVALLALSYLYCISVIFLHLLCLLHKNAECLFLLDFANLVQKRQCYRVEGISFIEEKISKQNERKHMLNTVVTTLLSLRGTG